MYSTKDLAGHILDEIIFLNTALQNKHFSEFTEDQILQRAVTRSLEIIGEAIKKIPEDIKKQYPEVNWREAAGMRDKLIHHYFGIDYQLVWDAVQEQLPSLKVTIQRMIDEQR